MADSDPKNDDQERINNLRAISGMDSERTKGTDFLGIPTGGNANTLSPQENVTVASLAKQAGVKSDPSNLYDKDQWGQIQDQAKQNLKEASTPKSTSGGTLEETSPYEALADAQANQYLQMTKNLDAYTSDYAAPSNQASVNAQTEADLGTSSTSPISQWLNQQTKAAAAQYAPTQAANQSVTAAEDNASKLEATGMEQLGTAETAEMHAAPYSQLLNALASDVPSKLLEGYNFTNLTGKNIPAGLKFAEQNLDITAPGSTTTAPTLPTPTLGPITNPSITAGESSPTPQS